MTLRARILVYVVAVMIIVFVMVVATMLPYRLRDSNWGGAAGREATAALQLLFDQLTAARRAELLNTPPRLFDQHSVLVGWVLAGADGKVTAWFMSEPRQETVGAAFFSELHF